MVATAQIDVAQQFSKLLRPGEELWTDVLSIKPVFESEEAIAESSGKKPKKGRLGRMKYEFRTADILNGNRRIYPVDVFTSALGGLVERIGKDVVFGNLDHPSMWDPESLIIKLSDAAVKIVEAKMTSDVEIRVVLDILDNEHGRQLVSVLDIGGNPGLSQRAIAEWREATEQEKERFGVPRGEYAVVAKVLRLITYDVVSEPSFSDAIGAKVTESKQGAGPMPFTLEQLKVQEPTAYAAAVAEGKSIAATELQPKIDAAIAERKPTIVTEAIKPLNEKLAAADVEKGKVVKALEAVKPAMVALGIVNETITDAQAAGQIATLTGENKTVKEQLEAEKKAHEATKAELATLRGDLLAAENLKLVGETFAGHPFRTQILKQCATKKLSETKQALEYAQGVARLLEECNPEAMKNGKKASEVKGAATTSGGSAVQATLETLIGASHADPTGAAGGGNGAGSDKGKANEVLAEFAVSGDQFAL